MKRLFLLLFLAPLICEAQKDSTLITFARPDKSEVSISDPIKPGERVDLTGVVVTGPVINLYKGYLTAKCKLVVKGCENCPQYVINCYRKENGYRRTFWADADCKKKPIFFTGRLIYCTWYDRNW